MDGQGQEPPPAAPWALTQYLQIRDWGDPYGGGWMTWPARRFASLRLARNVFNAWTSYTRAENRAEWTRKNPTGNVIVGMVKGARFGEEAELSAVERWELWREEAQ